MKKVFGREELWLFIANNYFKDLEINLNFYLENIDYLNEIIKELLLNMVCIKLINIVI